MMCRSSSQQSSVALSIYLWNASTLWSRLSVVFQECHSVLARHQNVHLLQVERLVRGGGPWAGAALHAMLTESSLPQSEGRWHAAILGSSNTDFQRVCCWIATLKWSRTKNLYFKIVWCSFLKQYPRKRKSPSLSLSGGSLAVPQLMCASSLSRLCSLSCGCATSYPASGSGRPRPWLGAALGIPRQDNTCSFSRSTSRGFSRPHSTTAFTKRWVELLLCAEEQRVFRGKSRQLLLQSVVAVAWLPRNGVWELSVLCFPGGWIEW